MDTKAVEALRPQLSRAAIIQCVAELFARQEDAAISDVIGRYLTPEETEQSIRTALDFRFVVLCVACRVGPVFYEPPARMAYLKQARDEADEAIRLRERAYRVGSIQFEPLDETNAQTIYQLNRSTKAFWKNQSSPGNAGLGFSAAQIAASKTSPGAFRRAVAAELTKLAQEAITENIERGRPEVARAEPALPTKGRAYFDE